jgi:hypothetical protein
VGGKSWGDTATLYVVSIDRTDMRITHTSCQKHMRFRQGF